MSRPTVPTERAPGVSAPVLSAALLERIHELNGDYLELLASERASPGAAAQLQHLTPGLAGSIAALATKARRDLAATPFTLYSLGFEDAGFWRAACELEAATLEQRYSSPGAVWVQGSFCETALLHAWHVASCNPLAARVLYAMPDVTANRLAATPLWRIKRVAIDCPALLTPRWPTNPAFWPDLVRFAAANDARRLRMAQSLGHQLIAAELDVAARANGGGNGSQALRSPRLRARRLRFELRTR